jgi:Arc/MetJ-type ribon-helix-helix transcriptional regulator
MTVKTTLSFTDRHHRFLTEKVGQGAFASQSAAVAAALEQMMRDEQERDLALSALAEEIRDRLATPAEDYVDQDAAFGPVRARLKAAREA